MESPLLFLSSLAMAADLVMDGKELTLTGEPIYDRVRLYNGSRLVVASGTRLYADSIFVDASSTIEMMPGEGSFNGLELRTDDLVLRGTVSGSLQGGALGLFADRLTCEGRLEVIGDSVAQNYNSYIVPCSIESSTVNISYVVPLDDDEDGLVHPEDCNTRNRKAFPGAPEQCNGIDDDCDGSVDEDIACACKVVQYNGHGYELCDVSDVLQSYVDWHTAREQCYLHGKHLIAIEDAEENNWLEGQLPIGDWWLGLNDIDTDGVFVWDGGAVSTFTDWKGGADYTHTDSDGQDCVQLLAWAGSWIDRPCEANLAFVCESCTEQIAFADRDGDGYGDPASSVWACFGPPPGAVFNDTDCNDDDPASYPGAPDPKGTRDQDCSDAPAGSIDSRDKKGRLSFGWSSGCRHGAAPEAGGWLAVILLLSLARMRSPTSSSRLTGARATRPRGCAG